MKHKTSRGKVSFEVKWENFAETTWEPKDNVHGCEAYSVYAKAHGLDDESDESDNDESDESDDDESDDDDE